MDYLRHQSSDQSWLSTDTKGHPRLGCWSSSLTPATISPLMWLWPCLLCTFPWWQPTIPFWPPGKGGEEEMDLLPGEKPRPVPRPHRTHSRTGTAHRDKGSSSNKQYNQDSSSDGEDLDCPCDQKLCAFENASCERTNGASGANTLGKACPCPHNCSPRYLYIYTHNPLFNSILNLLFRIFWSILKKVTYTHSCLHLCDFFEFRQILKHFVYRRNGILNGLHCAPSYPQRPILIYCIPFSICWKQTLRSSHNSIYYWGLKMQNFNASVVVVW